MSVVTFCGDFKLGIILKNEKLNRIFLQLLIGLLPGVAALLGVFALAFINATDQINQQDQINDLNRDQDIICANVSVRKSDLLFLTEIIFTF